ncbi:MAG TPA: beta-propeller fold lactonase family protein [Leptospiraceae bacterium]|nr:lactonase family protein [Leptospirales bacterium]HMX56799.1 beta-propeller fold lactonase family protein [Leptospiraceae bacterium]HMZ36962.1 beta-propeller fold lactonase family protein [Leptospiraceae bacterium]
MTARIFTMIVLCGCILQCGSTVACGDSDQKCSPLLSVLAYQRRTVYNLYVLHYDSNDIGQYRVGDDGIPVYKKSYSGLPAGPGGITSDRTGRTVYVSYDTSAAIQVYRIDDASGDLRLIQTVTGSGLSNSREAATVDVSNRFLYQVNGNGTISVFSIDLWTGMLTNTAISNTTGGGGARFGAIHPTNNYFYSGNVASNTVSFHTRASDGSLSLQGAITTAGTNGTSQIAIDSTGQYLYAPTFNAGENVYWFPIQANGSLGAVSSISCGNFCYQVWIHPGNRFVFAGGTAGHFMYGRNTSTGALSGPVSTQGASFRSAAGHPSGNFLYTASTGNPVSLRTLSVDSTSGAMAVIDTKSTTGNGTSACGIGLIGSIVF